MTPTTDGSTVEPTAPLALFLESSCGSHSVALGDASTGEVLEELAWSREQSRQDNLDALVGPLVDEHRARLAYVVVDAGPGNLATTRAAVSYANALTFALGIDLGWVDSLSVMASVHVARNPEPSGAAASAGADTMTLRRAGHHGWYARRAAPGSAPTYSIVAPDRVPRDGVATVFAQTDRDAVRDGLADLDRPAFVSFTAHDVARCWAQQGLRATAAPVEPLTEAWSGFDDAS